EGRPLWQGTDRRPRDYHRLPATSRSRPGGQTHIDTLAGLWYFFANTCGLHQGGKMFRTTCYVMAGVLTCLLFISLGLSQSTFGSITGSVKDPTGSVVPGAEV